MNEHLEVERYELFAESWYHFEFDRRQFLKAFSGGLVLLVPVANLLAETAQRQGESGRGGFGRDLPKEIGAWIHIDEDGSITAYTGKVEMGQNIRTSLTQAIAEELVFRWLMLEAGADLVLGSVVGAGLEVAAAAGLNAVAAELHVPEQSLAQFEQRRFVTDEGGEVAGWGDRDGGIGDQRRIRRRGIARCRGRHAGDVVERGRVGRGEDEMTRTTEGDQREREHRCGLEYRIRHASVLRR